MALRVNGTNTIISTTGNLGIGTLAPTANIAIFASTANALILLSQSNTGAEALNITSGHSIFGGNVTVTANLTVSRLATFIGGVNLGNVASITANTINVNGRANTGQLNVTGSMQATGPIFVGSNTVWHGGNLDIGANTVWHSGNDGAGSGLDADLLDGQSGAYYSNASTLASGTIPPARVSGSYTEISAVGTLSSLTVTGNVAVDTNTLFVNAPGNRVGINTTSPNNALDIIGNANVSGYMSVGSGSMISPSYTFNSFQHGFYAQSNRLTTVLNGNIASYTVDAGGQTQHFLYSSNNVIHLYGMTFQESNSIANNVGVFGISAIAPNSIGTSIQYARIFLAVTNTTSNLETGTVRFDVYSNGVFTSLASFVGAGTQNFDYPRLFLDANTRIHAQSGNVARPSYSFASDTDSGLYSIGPNQLGIAVNSTQIINVKTSGVEITGSLGINVASPTSSLHVAGTANVTGNVIVGGLTTLNSGLSYGAFRSTAANGSNVVLSSNATVFLYSNVGVTANLTITLPPSAGISTGHEVKLYTRNTITSLTMAGGTVFAAPTSLAAGNSISFIWSSTDAAWFRG